MINSKWIFAHYDNQEIDLISRTYKISNTLARIIINRGFTDLDDIKKFILKDASCFYDPYLLTSMNKAVDRINLAVKNNEYIAVYGDYDVDGITSTYIVYDYLKSIGANITYYIPDRIEEGYGINKSALLHLKNTGVRLVITVDTGTTAIDETYYAKQIGLDMVITDHHNISEELPDAVAVINPKIAGSAYPYENLAGVGVAFKLVYALSKMDTAIIDRYCDIAAIGTIADMVPLIDENRFIAHHGLNLLANTKNIGLKALMEVSGIDSEKITSSSIGFGIAPRLNAAGRIGSAKMSVELLLEENYSKAIDIACNLDRENKNRQGEEQNILSDALTVIDKNDLDKNNVIIVCGNDWHHGVIGIASSRITDLYYKPSIVISLDKSGIGKASSRSISGFDIFDALTFCKDDLIKYGGHELAAGLSIEEENINSFSDHINSYSNSLLTDEVLTRKIYIDDVIDIEDISLDTLEKLKILEPCGIGNRTPIFCIRGALIKKLRYLQTGKHVFVTIKKSGKEIELPSFNTQSSFRDLEPGDIIDIVGTLCENTYKNVTKAQFIIKDFKISMSYNLTRDNLSIVYKYIMICADRNTMHFTRDEIISFIKVNSGKNYSLKRVILCLDVFKELGLIQYNYENNLITIKKGINFNNKTDLMNSNTFVKYNNI